MKETEPGTGQRIGLALSGGGFRATAFGLGCLRALHDRDLLRRVTIVSGISGGSLLAALWAYGPSRFEEFDDTVVTLLRSGLTKTLVTRAVAPRHLARVASKPLTPLLRALNQTPRPYSRTDLLIEALGDKLFGGKTMGEVTHRGLATLISATDLVTTNAVRFGSVASACSAHGRISGDIRVAEAVGASAAFPILLPAVQRTYEFIGRDGTIRDETVQLADGGVYENLGLLPLLPGRSRHHTAHVYDVDYVIAVDAGRGRSRKSTPALTPFRLARSFDITYNRTQDGSRAQLNAAMGHGQLRGFVHAYLAMPDTRLPVPLADLVPRMRVASYPTDFAAMKEDDLRSLCTRGEQLVRVLLTHYCPELS